MCVPYAGEGWACRQGTPSDTALTQRRSAPTPIFTKFLMKDAFRHSDSPVRRVNNMFWRADRPKAKNGMEHSKLVDGWC